MSLSEPKVLKQLLFNTETSEIFIETFHYSVVLYFHHRFLLTKAISINT